MSTHPTLGQVLMSSAIGPDEDDDASYRQLLGTYPIGEPHPYPGERLEEDGRTWIVTTVAMLGGSWAAYGYELTDD